jgi:co-chaperonin GroES (HSP10)
MRVERRELGGARKSAKTTLCTIITTVQPTNVASLLPAFSRPKSLQPPETTDTGLYKPEEEQPKLHLAKVLSVGPGREEENGILAAMPTIAVGDTVVVKNPWGIGPKDEETVDGRKLSYARGVDIAGVVKGGVTD